MLRKININRSSQRREISKNLKARKNSSPIFKKISKMRLSSLMDSKQREEKVKPSKAIFARMDPRPTVDSFKPLEAREEVFLDQLEEARDTTSVIRA